MVSGPAPTYSSSVGCPICGQWVLFTEGPFLDSGATFSSTFHFLGLHPPETYPYLPALPQGSLSEACSNRSALPLP